MVPDPALGDAGGAIVETSPGRAGSDTGSLSVTVRVPHGLKSQTFVADVEGRIVIGVGNDPARPTDKGFLVGPVAFVAVTAPVTPAQSANSAKVSPK